MKIPKARRRYVTRIERFRAGDYPLVCVVSGEADAVELVCVSVRRVSLWPWMFLFLQPLIFFLMGGASQHVVVGWLPLAKDSMASSVTGYYEPGVGVVIQNAHHAFIAACREVQGLPPVSV